MNFDRHLLVTCWQAVRKTQKYRRKVKTNEGRKKTKKERMKRGLIERRRKKTLAQDGK